MYKKNPNLFHSNPKLQKLFSLNKVNRDFLYLSWGQVHNSELSEILYSELEKLRGLASKLSDYDITVAAHGQGLPELRTTLSMLPPNLPHSTSCIHNDLPYTHTGGLCHRTTL